MTSTSTLCFYEAFAQKRITFNNGIAEKGSLVFLAKWNDLYVIAKDSSDFFFVAEAQAPEYVKTNRDANNKPVPAATPPAISPTSPAFLWTVQYGVSCPDGTDETSYKTGIKPTKEEAFKLAACWDQEASANLLAFIRIRGPGFYQIKRLTPRPVVAANVVPAPVAVPATQTQSPRWGRPRFTMDIESGHQREETIWGPFLVNNELDTQRTENITAFRTLVDQQRAFVEQLQQTSSRSPALPASQSAARAYPINDSVAEILGRHCGGLRQRR